MYAVDNADLTNFYVITALHDRGGGTCETSFSPCR